MTVQRSVGLRGEETAANYLDARGYEIRGRNVRVGPHDEIDILAYDRRDGVLVFVEVKARSHADGSFRPEMNAGFRKRERMKRAARLWIAEHGYEGGYRIDLLSVVGSSVVAHFCELSWE
ncbi:MAG: YraN family protein [Candidatus Peribacteraceae bacterium]|nr:YraN family protein [Candidatus Peribacteraceae bacterium]